MSPDATGTTKVKCMQYIYSLLSLRIGIKDLYHLSAHCLGTCHTELGPNPPNKKISFNARVKVRPPSQVISAVSRSSVITQIPCLKLYEVKCLVKQEI